MVGWALGCFDGSEKVDFIEFQVMLDYWNPKGGTSLPRKLPNRRIVAVGFWRLALLRRPK